MAMNGPYKAAKGHKMGHEKEFPTKHDHTHPPVHSHSARSKKRIGGGKRHGRKAL